MTLYTHALEAMERKLFTRVLTECGWNQSEACERLGINRATLRTKLRAYGISKPADMKRTFRPPRYPRTRRTSYPAAKRANARYAVTHVIEEVVVDANRRAG